MFKLQAEIRMALLRPMFEKYIQWNIRSVSTSYPRRKKVPDIKLKGRSKSSQEWLIRQMTDPYVELTKKNNFRYCIVLSFYDVVLHQIHVYGTH